MEIEEHIKNMKFNSMFYWYPKIKDLPIPQPKTEMYKFNESEFKMIQREEGIPKTLFENCLPVAEKIGFPLFMRTDNSSCKHYWDKTCYVPDRESLERHIFELISNSSMQGWMSYVDNGLLFREYIPLTTKFTAFMGNFPVNKERRYFIKDGKVQCHHPYWYPDSMEGHTEQKNWRPIVDVLNYETESEIKKLTKFAELVGTVIDGYWSVDFAISKKKVWYLFDMAIGDNSFHWLDCKYCPEEQKKQYKQRIKKLPNIEIFKEKNKVG
jgi:hypothetical protein